MTQSARVRVCFPSCLYKETCWDPETRACGDRPVPVPDPPEDPEVLRALVDATRREADSLWDRFNHVYKERTIAEADVLRMRDVLDVALAWRDSVVRSAGGVTMDETIVEFELERKLIKALDAYRQEGIPGR